MGQNKGATGAPASCGLLMRLLCLVLVLMLLLLHLAGEAQATPSPSSMQAPQKREFLGATLGRNGFDY
ncbi:GL17500 [Drosophila persimilis]|uniref:GL17500 n=1 Tax=Drosophila persimilis TaxID=7234 RepID=B4GHC3_DROPE|nr:GL17500 [Drosophila persimilis]